MLSASEPRRILLIRPSALGDVARTVPALVSLRRAYPEAQLDWLVHESFVDAIAHHPDLHEAIPFPRSRFGRFARDPRVAAELMRYLRDLRRRRYDAVYDLQGLGRSGFLSRATGAPRRVGPADARELGWLGYNRRCRIDPAVRHTVDRMLAVLEQDGIEPIRDMQLYVGPEDREWAATYIERLGIEPDRCAVLAPTARWRSKCWPIERFDALADRLGDLGFRACLVVGAPDERERVRPLLREPEAGRPKRLDLTGRTTVGQLMAVIERCGLLVANDSAALHLGVGLGRPVVGIYGPTNPAEVGPYGRPESVVWAGGDHSLHYRSARPDQRVIGAIPEEEVRAAVQRVLQGPPSEPSVSPEPAPEAVS